MLETLPAAALIALLVAWLTYNSGRALRTGVARAARGVSYRRTDQRGWFWFAVVGQAAVAAIGALAVLWLVSR